MYPGLDFEEAAYWLEEQDAAEVFGLSDAGGSAGEVPTVTFPGAPLRILVELFLGGSWVDISAYVLWARQIVIQRGRTSAQRRSQPAWCSLTLRNDTKAFSPRNISGPWFGLLRSNVKLRVWVDAGLGMSKRFDGKVPSWVPQLKSHPNDGTLSITAFGRRNQIEGKGSDTVLRSAMYRSVSADTNVVAYWPLEEGDEADSFASATPGIPALTPNTSVNLASDTGLTGSAPLPTFEAAGTVAGALGWTPPNGRWQLDWHYNMPSGVASTKTILRMYAGGGTVAWWELIIDSSDQYTVRGMNAAGVAVTSLGPFAPGANVPIVGAWVHFSITAQQNGANVDWLYKYFPSLGGTGATLGTSFAGTLGGVSGLEIPAGVTGMATGHIVIYDGYNYTQPGLPAFGYPSERPTTRFARLLTEEGIDYSIRELIQETQRMGPQRIDTLGNHLRQCEAVNEGLVHESFDNEVELVSRTWYYSPDVALTLDHAQGQILPPLAVPDDDQFVRNDWTIQRVNGATAQFRKATGPNNASEPEDDQQGAGHKPDSETLNLYRDSAALDHAVYRTYRDTVDEPRIDGGRVNLAKSPELIKQWLRCDIGSRVQVVNPPADLGPDLLSTTLQGYQETIAQGLWEVVPYLEPDDIHRVGIYDDLGSRYDCPASTVRTALDTTATSLDLSIAVGDNCVWAHDYGDYTVVVGREQMLVTAVSAVTGPGGSGSGSCLTGWEQTLTVQRSYNGVVASHAVGAEVHVRDFGLYGL